MKGLRSGSLGCAIVALCLGACAVAVPPTPDASADAAIQAAVAEVTEDRLRAVLESIDFVRTPESPDIAAAEASLKGWLSAAGYTVTTEPTGSASTWIAPMNTIVAEKPGADPSLRPVFVTAHWDSAGDGHGMDDNGSGVAAVVVSATVLAPRTLDRTVRFILFANEERAIDGSREYVAALSDAELPASFVNYESVGYVSLASDPLSVLAGQARGDWIGAYAPDWAAASLASFDAAARRFSPELRFVAAAIPDEYQLELLLQSISQSDNLWFWNRGVPGVMLSDGAFMRNPNYHSSSDLIGTLDLAFLAAVTRAAIASICVDAGILP